jgi:hypothetical protein
VGRIRGAGADPPLVDGSWPPQTVGPQHRERILPPLYLVRCLGEVHSFARYRHQSGHVVQRLHWGYVALLGLQKMVIFVCQPTRRRKAKAYDDPGNPPGMVLS